MNDDGHYVESFLNNQGIWGWHCLTCDEESTYLQNLAEAEAAGREHSLLKFRAAIRRQVAEEIVAEIDRCADVLVTEQDDSGHYLTAAILQKAADIARVVGGLPKRGES